MAQVGEEGLWIDLVNLRSETYAEGSRIPTMEFGNPEQVRRAQHLWKALSPVWCLPGGREQIG